MNNRTRLTFIVYTIAKPSGISQLQDKLAKLAFAKFAFCFLVLQLQHDIVIVGHGVFRILDTDGGNLFPSQRGGRE